MRTAIPLLLAGLAVPSLLPALAPGAPAPTTQEGAGEGQDDRANPLLPKPQERQLSLAEKENLRIEAGLTGAWLLTNYFRADTIVPSNEVQGFAIFHDGYLAFTFQALEDDEDFFFEEAQYVIQSAVFRYRVFEGVYLQVAGMMGYTNANEDYELEFGSTRVPREYTVTLTDDTLSLRRPGGVGFDFRRMQESAFPEAASEHLRRTRGGYELIDDTDPFGGTGDDTTPPRGDRRRRGDDGDGDR